MGISNIILAISIQAIPSMISDIFQQSYSIFDVPVFPLNQSSWKYIYSCEQKNYSRFFSSQFSTMPTSPDQHLPSVHLSMQQFVTQAFAIFQQPDIEDDDKTLRFIQFVLCGRRLNGLEEERIFVDQYLPFDPNNVRVEQNAHDLMGVTNTLPFYKEWGLTPFLSEKIEHSFGLWYTIQGTVCIFIYVCRAYVLIFY
jgi:hypothetical protein